MPKNSDPSGLHGFRYLLDKAKRSRSPRPPTTPVDGEAPAVGRYHFSRTHRDSSPATPWAEPASIPYTQQRDSPQTRGGITPPTCWEKALGELTDKQRQVLETFGIENSKTFEAEIETLQSLKDCCTSNLTPGKTDKTPIMTRVRIHNILKKMEKYAMIGDIALQHNPSIVALVWAGVRFCLQVALNDVQTFEGVSSALDDIASVMGSCRIYEKIYANELESAKAVIGQLPRLYAHCLRFMAEAIDYYQTKTPMRVAKGVTNPFETRFKPLIDEINNGKGELERRCAVASHELQDKMSESQREQFGKLNDQLVQFQLGIARVSTGVEGLLAHVSGDKRRSVLKWLSEVNFGAHHEGARQLRFDGTGEWLFGKRVFEDWIESECSSMMWLFGKAGSGKTILSSLVIDTLAETYKSAPTIYFYCNYGESERRQTLSVIGSLLKQLSTTRGCEDLDPKMVSIYDNGNRLNARTSEDLFAAALSRFEKVFVVVDALDECSEEERKAVVMLFIRQLKLNDRCHLKVILTSRPENDLSKMLKNNPCHQIDANDTSKDITPFVAAELNEHIISGALLDGNVTSALRKELIDTISVQADGMFLWAKLQLDHICKQGNEEEVRAQLKKLPRSLESTYERIWARINDADDTERKWALKTLKWVLHAKEPLEPAEILEATALEPFDTTFDQKRMASSLEYLIQVCGNFIAMDVQTNRLRFVHYSVQEFLGKKEEFRSAADLVAEVCLTVLGNEEVGNNYLTVWGDDRSQAGNGGNIYGYAIANWASHCRTWEAIDDRRGNLIRRSLLNEKCFQNMQKRRRSPESTYEVASHFNLPVILQHLQQLGLHDEGFAQAQSMALIKASSYGYLAVVKVFVEGRADVDAENGSALQGAAWGGHEEVVELLLKAGAYVNARGGSALREAAAGGHEKVVQVLLNAKADVNASGGSALRAAAEHGHEKSMELLLNAGADVNADGGSALRAAAEHGHEKSMELLLNAGADVNADGGSALREAARGGHEKYMELLLKAGADVNANDGSALREAATSGHEKIVELLLKAGADVNASGGSALREAATSGDLKLVELLLKAGAYVNASGGSALREAAAGGHEKVVQVLLNAGADVNADGGSALRAAAEHGHEKVVEQLFEAGAVVNAGDISGLREAARHGHVRIVELLLKAGADVNAENGSAFQEAVRYGHEKIIKLLFEAGTDLRAENASTFRVAAARGDLKLVELLLKAGADVKAENGYAFREAAKHGHEKVVELLLNAGADVNAADGYALREAAARDRVKVVELLLKAGADVNAADGYALKIAARCRHVKVVELLRNAQGAST